MSDRTSPLYDGTMERTASGGVIRFERRLDYGIRDVWDSITNPERLADWWLPFDAEIAIDLREGGDQGEQDHQRRGRQRPGAEPPPDVRPASDNKLYRRKETSRIA